MSIAPALLAIQLSTMTSSSSRHGFGGLASSEPRTGFRSLGDRGINLKGWRYFLFSVLMVTCLLIGLLLAVAFIGVTILVAAWISVALSPWTLLGTAPLGLAAVFGFIWGILRVLI